METASSLCSLLSFSHETLAKRLFGDSTAFVDALSLNQAGLSYILKLSVAMPLRTVILQPCKEAIASPSSVVLTSLY